MKPPLATLLFLILFFQKKADAQTAEPFLESARSLALATATTAVPGEPGMTSNPASLAFFEKKTALAATAATPYFIQNWKKLTLAVAVPMGRTGRFSVALARAGIPELFQSNFRIGIRAAIDAKNWGRADGQFFHHQCWANTVEQAGFLPDWGCFGIQKTRSGSVFQFKTRPRRAGKRGRSGRQFSGWARCTS